MAATSSLGQQQRPRTVATAASGTSAAPISPSSSQSSQSAQSQSLYQSVLLPRLISGSVGSIVTALAVTPLEVVKVRQQASSSSSSFSSSFSGAATSGAGQPRSGAAGQQSLPEGVARCRGCGTFVFNNGLAECVLPRNAVPYFASAASSAASASSSSSANSSASAAVTAAREVGSVATRGAAARIRDAATSNASSGASARARASAAAQSSSSSASHASPTTRASLNPVKGAANDGTFTLLRTIFRSEGLSGIYAGLAPTLVMSVPNTVLYFTAYDEIVDRLRRRGSTRRGKIAGVDRSTEIDAEREAEEGQMAANPLLEQPIEGHRIGSLYDSVLVPLVGGSSARLLATAATSPLELVRTRQASRVGMGLPPSSSSSASSTPASSSSSSSSAQSSANASNSMANRSNMRTRPNGTANNVGTISELRHMIANEGGISALYRGLAPTLWRDVPFSAIYWMFLERFKSELRRLDGPFGGGRYVQRGEDVPPWLQAGHAFVGGAGAGMIAAACTTPMDVVKTRRQMVQHAAAAEEIAARVDHVVMTAGGEAAAAAVACDHGGAVVFDPHSSGGQHRTRTSIGRPKGTIGHMTQIVREEGVTALWRGNATRMIKVAPACAIMIGCYELGKRVLGDAV